MPFRFRQPIWLYGFVCFEVRENDRRATTASCRQVGIGPLALVLEVLIIVYLLYIDRTCFESCADALYLDESLFSDVSILTPRRDDALETACTADFEPSVSFVAASSDRCYNR